MTVRLESFGSQDSSEASYLVAAAVTYHTRYALVMTVTVIIGRSCIEFKRALADVSCREGSDLGHHQVESKPITLEAGVALVEM